MIRFMKFERTCS